MSQAITTNLMHLLAVVGLGCLLRIREKTHPARVKPREIELRVNGLALAFLAVVIAGNSVGGALATSLVSPWQAVVRAQSFMATLPWFVAIPATSLVLDASSYWVHRAMHTDALWRIHRWHHSPEYLNWFSGFRASWLHIVFLSVPTTALVFISGGNPWILGTVAIQGAYAMLIHVNFDSKSPLLAAIMVTPQYHRIHHGRGRELQDSNFGFCWRLWDKLFGTETDPAQVPRDFPLGVADSDRKTTHLRMAFGLEPAVEKPVPSSPAMASSRGRDEVA